VKDVAIIGAGPAGIAAAIYLKRAGADLVLIEKGEVGGLLRSANLVENYPGFPNGVSGLDITSVFEEQMKTLSIRPKKATVTRLDVDKNSFNIETDSGSLRSKNVIICTGTVPSKLELDGADGPAGKSILYDVNSVPKKTAKSGTALIVGGGDAAFDYALNLNARGREVKIISRSGAKCLPLLLERVKKEKIKVITADPTAIRKVAEGIEMDCVSGKRKMTIEGELLLVAIGRLPKIDFLGPKLKKNLKILNKGPETNIEGLYLAGDVVGGSYRQTGIAVGGGILAAMMIQDSSTRGGAR
jgi:thioredoxin reductase (NADPH)